MSGVTAVRSGLELGRVKRWVARWRTSLWTLLVVRETSGFGELWNGEAYSTPQDSATLQQRAETVRRLRDRRRGVILLVAEDGVGAEM